MTNRTRRNSGLIMALAALGTAGCEKLTTMGAPPHPGPSLATAAVITGMKGTGAIGDGAPTSVGVNRQWFDLDAGISGGVVYGQLNYIDSAFVKEDGNYPHFVVGSSWPGTAVVSFVQTSLSCVEFEGVGQLLNTGELLAFRVLTCDNAQPGVGFDEFGIQVPQRLLTHGAVYRAGPASLAYGELTLSGSSTSLGTP